MGKYTWLPPIIRQVGTLLKQAATQTKPDVEYETKTFPCGYVVSRQDLWG